MLNALMSILRLARVGGASPSNRIGRSGLIRAAWHDPRRVAAAEEKRVMRADKVRAALAAGGYRSSRWHRG